MATPPWGTPNRPGGTPDNGYHDEHANPLLSAAIRYAGMGWAVFPLYEIENGRCACGQQCDSPGKHPRLSKGLQSATMDVSTIMGWWEMWPTANIGVLTGRASGMFVVDIDPKNGGDIDQLGEIPDTVTQLTGGGGQHLLFRYPPEGKIRQGTNVLGPGLDTRSDGGYIVAWPSTHISGRTYEWEASSDPTEGIAPNDAPPQLLTRLYHTEASAPPAVDTLPGPDLPLERVEELRSALTAIPADDYGLWIEVGMALHSTGAANAFGLWDSWSARSDSYKPGECAKKWHSFHSGGVEVESVFFRAQQYGWVNPLAGAAPPLLAPVLQSAGQPFLISAVDLIANARPPDFVVDGLKTADSLGSDFGGWGVGKSFRAMDEAARISLGLAANMRQTKQGPVVYVIGEGMGGIGRRLMAWQQYWRQDLKTAPLMFTRSAVAFLDPAETSSLYGHIARLADQCGAPPVAIYIDTLARNFGAGDESKAPDMTRFIASVDRFVREPFGACVTIVHHSGHMDASRGRGSSVLPAALDWEYRLDLVGDKTVRMSNGRSPKDFESPKPCLYQFETVHMTLFGEAATSAVLVPDNSKPAIAGGETGNDSGPAVNAGTHKQRPAFETLVRLFSEHKANLAGYENAVPRVSIADWRAACIAAGFTSSDGFRKLKKGLEASGKVRSEGGFSYPLASDV